MVSEETWRAFSMAFGGGLITFVIGNVFTVWSRGYNKWRGRWRVDVPHSLWISSFSHDRLCTLLDS